MFFCTVRYVESAEYEGRASAMFHDVTVKWCVELLTISSSECLLCHVSFIYIYIYSQEQEYVTRHWLASKRAR
jgi:hypothetical protein